jgi:hypothetical protein
LPGFSTTATNLIDVSKQRDISMNKTNRKLRNKRSKILFDKANKIFKNSFVQTIIFGIILMSIEYKSGLFQTDPGVATYSILPLWSIIATLNTIALILGFKKFVYISFDSQNYFREQFSIAVLSTLILSSAALAISLFGQRMFWYPFIAIFYTLSSQKLTVTTPLWSEYGFLIVLTMLFYLIALTRHQNWDGLKSIQQYELDRKNESSEMIVEGFREIIRILNRESGLKKYSELDANQLLSQLEQSEDDISQSWEEQSRELIRLSSSSYVIDENSGWHDRQGCWVGQNIDTGDLFFLHPAQSVLSNLHLDNFLNYSEVIAKSKNLKVGELIVAFKENTDRLATPTNLYLNIRFETEQDLLEKLVNFTDYRNDVRKRVTNNKLTDSDLTLHDVYFPSQFFTTEEGRAFNDVEGYLQKVVNESSQRQIALLGEYGQGKSSSTLMFTFNLLCKSNALPKRIPILIELRGKSPRDLRPLELFGAWAAQYRIDPQALMRLHIAGRLVLIFEGFDEMSLIGNSELRLRHFRSLWKFCYPNAKIIITGRPNFFLDDRELKTALGIIKPTTERPYCEAIRLAPFNIDRIREALRSHKQLVRDQICELAEKEPRFLDLVSRPSLLHVVSTIWEKENLDAKAQLLNSAYVMECFVRNSYRRQGLKAQGSRDFMALNSSERDYFMCGIAAYMADKQLSNQISNEQLSELIDKLIEVIPDSVSTSLPEIFGEDTRPLRLRIQDPKEDIDHIKTDVRTCGLLVDDPSAPGTFKFGHKSFMEYLFASIIKEHLWDADSAKARAIRKAIFFPIEIILDIPVSVGFLAEMISSDNVGKQNKVLINDASGLRKERNIANRLLAVIFNSKEKSFYFSFLHSNLFVLSCLFFLNSDRKRRIAIILFTGFASVIFYTILPSRSSVTETFLGISLNLIVMIFSIIMSTIITIMYLSLGSNLISGTGRKSSIALKFRLWNCLCKELKLDDRVLHQIAGTWLIPQMKNQPFDYFLKRDL